MDSHPHRPRRPFDLVHASTLPAFRRGVNA
jgi:hypothetical protein